MELVVTGKAPRPYIVARISLLSETLIVKRVIITVSVARLCLDCLIYWIYGDASGVGFWGGFCVLDSRSVLELYSNLSLRALLFMS